MTSRRFLVLSASLLLALGACIVNSYDEATPGPPDASSDAPSASPDTGPTDPADAGPTDPADTGPTDAGADTNAPFDAAPPPTLSVTDFDAGEYYCSGASAPKRQFCWDFGGVNAVTGWQRIWPDAGTGLATTTGEPGNRGGKALRATMSNDAATGSSNFVAYNLNILETDLVVAERLALGFNFRVESADVETSVASLVVNGTPYGLSVHPAACAGQSCLGENSTASRPASLLHASAFRAADWYRGEVVLTKQAGGGWSGQVLVGGKLVAERKDAIPSLGPAVIAVAVGAVAAPRVGQAVTLVDNVYVRNF